MKILNAIVDMVAAIGLFFATTSCLVFGATFVAILFWRWFSWIIEMAASMATAL